MKFLKLSDLPAEHTCNVCGATKPIGAMLLVHKQSDGYELRPRCKDCHNKKERGHRSTYKRNYLKRWRARNPKLEKSYRDTDACREQNRIRVGRFIKNHRDAVAIQRRLRTQGIKVSWSRAEELLAKFGPCYPSRFGLTSKGLRECERIRAAMRRRSGTQFSNAEIRMMVYEDGLFVAPTLQARPYQKAAENMRRRQADRRGVVQQKRAA